MAGALICFTGVDGSGKTTQAKWIVERLQAAGHDARYVWSRGEARWRRPLLDLGRLVLRAPSPSPAPFLGRRSEYELYHARKSRLFQSPVARWLWGELVRFEHVAQIRARVLPLVRSGAIVVTDRYVWDSTVDLAVAFNAGESWLAGAQRHRAFRLVPAPDLSLFLDVPLATALARKDDIPTPAYIDRRIGLYRYLATRCSMVCLDGCLDAATINALVLRHALAAIAGREGSQHA